MRMKFSRTIIYRIMFLTIPIIEIFLRENIM